MNTCYLTNQFQAAESLVQANCTTPTQEIPLIFLELESSLLLHQRPQLPLS